MDWFLYDKDYRHERVTFFMTEVPIIQKPVHYLLCKSMAEISVIKDRALGWAFLFSYFLAPYTSVISLVIFMSKNISSCNQSSLSRVWSIWIRNSLFIVLKIVHWLFFFHVAKCEACTGKTSLKKELLITFQLIEL